MSHAVAYSCTKEKLFSYVASMMNLFRCHMRRSLLFKSWLLVSSRSSHKHKQNRLFAQVRETRARERKKRDANAVGYFLSLHFVRTAILRASLQSSLTLRFARIRGY